MNNMKQRKSNNSNNNLAILSSLEVESQDAINIELNWKCRMNQSIYTNKKEINYKCALCGLIVCEFCIENCHRSHRQTRKFEHLKNDVASFNEFPCQCALAKHVVKTEIFSNFSSEESGSKTGKKGKYCKDNNLFKRSNPKYYYKRKEDNSYFCLYCIHNYTKKNQSDLSRNTVSTIGRELSSNIEKFDTLTEFYNSYEKVPYQIGDPIPSCSCDDIQHKHESQKDNVVNFINFINSKDQFHYVNTIKMTYQLFHDYSFVSEYFSEFVFIQGIIDNSKKEFNPLIKNEVIFQDLRDWKGYFKTFWFFSILLNNITSINNSSECLSPEMKNNFGYEMVSYVLSVSSNQKVYWFQTQTQFIRMYRKFYIPNMSLSQFLSLKENISPIHRLLFSLKSDISFNQKQSHSEFLQTNIELVDKLFNICDEMKDSKKISPLEYSEMIIECLKFINSILPYCYYDIKKLKKLFKKVIFLVNLSKEKKENLNEIIHVTEHISVMILTYINDHKLYKKILMKKGGTKQLIEELDENQLFDKEINWSFQENKLNKSIITTLFSLDLTIHEQMHYIENKMFYDNLLNENDYYLEPLLSSICSPLMVRLINDKHNDTAIVDIIRGKMRKVLKDNPQTDASFVSIKEIFAVMDKHLLNMFNSIISEEVFIDKTQIFLGKLKDLLSEDLCNNKNNNRFINQILFVKNQYFGKLFDFINIAQWIQTYLYNIEADKPVFQIQIGKITASVQSRLKMVLLYLTKDNPLIASLLLSHEYIDLILLKQSINLDLYLILLKQVFKKSKYYVNLDDLVEYIMENFVQKILNSIKNNIPLAQMVLQIFKYILSISSKKSVMNINNKIATAISSIMSNPDFKGMLTIQLETNDQYKKIVSLVFNCINRFQNEYIFIMVPKIDIEIVISILENLDLLPDMRRSLCKTYMKYFTYVNISKDEDSVNISTKSTEMKEQREKTLKPIIETLKNYKVYYVKHKTIFNNNIKFLLGYFQDTVFEPCLNALYTISYFSNEIKAEEKYSLYCIVYLFYECLYLTLDNFENYDLNNKKNIKAISKYIKEDAKISQMKKKVCENLESLQQRHLIEIPSLISNYIEVSEKFVFYQKYCVENSDYLTTNNKCQIDNVIALSVFVEEADSYIKEKIDYETNNVLKDIFTSEDDDLKQVQTNITLDLLFKLNYIKKDQLTNQDTMFDFMHDMKKGLHKIFRFDSIKRESVVKNSAVAKGASTFRFKFSQMVKKKSTCKSDTSLGEYHKPLINIYIEEKTSIIESIDRLFKSNPGLWQQLIVANWYITRNIINIFIEKQLPFLVKIIFVDYNRLYTRKTPYYDSFLYILEFLRLLCEDHNPIFQTLLINYEKAVGNNNPESEFISMIFKLPCAILKNLKHAKSKTSYLEGFKRINWDFFNPLALKVTDFLIEIIQGTYSDNFNDLTSGLFQNSRSSFAEYIDIHYHSLDYLDANSEYEYPMAQFFRFVNCFIEENANPLSVKMLVISSLNPKRLFIFGINSYKKLCNKNIKDLLIQTYSHQALLAKFIKSDEELIEDPLFTISTGIFVYLKRVNCYQVKGIGDQFTQILDSLKMISNEQTENEENSAKLTKKEYYKFCDNLIKENEISFVEDKYKSEKELDKYKYFFSPEYKEEFLNKRNENSKLKATCDTVFFMIHPDSLYLTKRDTASFISKSTFTTFNGKLNSLLDYYPELSNRIDMRKMLSENKFLLFLFKLHYDRLESLNAFIGLFTNILIVLSISENIIIPIAIAHLIALFFLIAVWFSFNIIKYVKFKEEKPTLLSTINFVGMSFFNMEIFCFLWTFLWGFLSVSFRSLRFLFSLQIFTFYKIVPTMGSVIYAVKVRYKQFLSTAFLLVILILFYSSVTFYFFKVKEDGTLFCNSYLECFLLLFNNGIRFAGLPFSMKTKDTVGYWSEFIYSWMFYFIIILIIINIINGIIVDTFQALREQNNEIDEEKLNVCFICSLKRSNFEMKGIDFEHHTSFEHNIENYFKYITKILRTDEHDLNSIDFQVFNCIKQHKIEFFPIKKAKSLDKSR